MIQVYYFGASMTMVKLGQYICAVHMYIYTPTCSNESVTFVIV